MLLIPIRPTCVEETLKQRQNGEADQEASGGGVEAESLGVVRDEGVGHRVAQTAQHSAVQGEVQDMQDLVRKFETANIMKTQFPSSAAISRTWNRQYSSNSSYSQCSTVSFLSSFSAGRMSDVESVAGSGSGWVEV